MAERIVLDPSGIDSTRTSLDITPWIGADGVDWGDAGIQTYLAEQVRGETPVDYRVPNREVSAPLVFNTAQGGTTTLQARAKIQAKVALFQREGGAIMRVTDSGGTVYADVVDAGFRATSVPGWASRGSADPGASLSLTCQPDFYGEETTLADHTETSLPVLIFTDTSVSGDYPARVRIVVDEDDSDTQLGLLWGFRSRYYNSATAAALGHEAETLQTLDTAAKAALSGASGGTVVTHGTLSTNWTPVVGTNIGGTTYMTHQGSYRVWARLYSTSGTTVQARLAWDVGDMVAPTENAAFRLPSGTAFYWADLGEVRLDAPPVGTHRWQGQVQGKGDVGAENLSVDYLAFQPLDEGAGMLTYRDATQLTGGSVFVSDPFNQTAGSLTTKVLPTGGTWTGAGDADGADDFQTSGASTYYISRTAVSDADANTGRYAIAGVPGAAANSVLTNTNAVVTLKSVSAAVTTNDRFGVFARYTDTSNWLFWGVTYYSALNAQASLIKRVAGTTTTIWNSSTVGTYLGNSSGIADEKILRLQVFANGVWIIYGNEIVQAYGYDSALVTGGSLASGKVGIYDARVSATACTRIYDDFAAAGDYSTVTPSVDAVLYATRSAQLTTDGMFRQDAGGNAYGPVSIVAGDLPRYPVAGLESRTTQVFLKGSRGDFDQVADAGIDDISARVTYRPCWLFVPDS